MSQSEIKSFTPKEKNEWRLWLEENHREKDAIWLIQYKKVLVKSIYLGLMRLKLHFVLVGLTALEKRLMKKSISGFLANEKQLAIGQKLIKTSLSS